MFTKIIKISVLFCFLCPTLLFAQQVNRIPRRIVHKSVTKYIKNEHYHNHYVYNPEYHTHYENNSQTYSHTVRRTRSSIMQDEKINAMITSKKRELLWVTNPQKAATIRYGKSTDEMVNQCFPAQQFEE